MEAWEEIEEIENDLEQGRMSQADADLLIHAISEEYANLILD